MTSDATIGTGDGAGAALELAPWQTRPLPWLRRFVALRFAAFVPLVGILLWAVSRDAVGSPSALFLVVLGIAAANLAFFLVSRRLPESSAAAGPLLLSSLVLDALFVVVLASLVGGGGGPLAAFVLLPVLGAGLALPERGAIAVAGAAVVLLLLGASAGADVASAATRDGTTATAPGVGAGATALGLAVLLSATTAGVLWYRRRGRYLEERVARLEAERRAPSADRPPSPPPAGPSRDGSSDAPRRLRHVAAVAGAVAETLRDPAASVLAETEALRRRVRERRELRAIGPDLERVLAAAGRLDVARRTLDVLAEARGRGAAVATDVREVVRDLKQRVQSDLDRAGVRLRVECATTLPDAAAGPEEVRLVVERLLDAAREAAVAAGRTARVLVRVTLQDDRVVVLVRDPLPSPPSEDDWFDPAYSPAGRRGLGLALALARAVAERRDGEARAAPSGKQGLAVRISWPVAAATGEAAPADRDAAPDPRAKRAATAAKAAEPAEDRAAIRARIRAVIRDAV